MKPANAEAGLRVGGATVPKSSQLDFLGWSVNSTLSPNPFITK